MQICVYGIKYEGDANESCRGQSIWDTFTQEFPGICLAHSLCACVRY
jgi:hypothetical protein